jgi:hypothetical protein
MSPTKRFTKAANCLRANPACGEVVARAVGHELKQAAE